MLWTDLPAELLVITGPTVSNTLLLGAANRRQHASGGYFTSVFFRVSLTAAHCATALCLLQYLEGCSICLR
ncbi:hypothetical protein [Pseudomonas lini]